MASPDARSYIDLTVYDMQPVDIYDAAIEYARTTLPEWTPITGSIEDAILQSASYMTGQLLGAINRLPSGNIEGLLRLFGIERNSGTSASGVAQINFVNSNGYTVPAGTRCGYSVNEGDQTTLYIFQTTENVSVPIGSTSASVALEGITLTEYPDIPAGTTLQLLSAVASINSITLTQDLTVGSNAESTTEFLSRGINKFASLSEALVTPSQFTAYITDTYTSAYRVLATSRLKKEKSITALTRSGSTLTAAIGASHGLKLGDVCRIVDSTSTGTSFDGVYMVTSTNGASVSFATSNTSATPGISASTVMLSHKFQTPSQNGYLSIYVSDLNGASVSGSTLKTIEDDLTNRAIAGLTIRADNARVVPIGIAVTVTKKTGFAYSGQAVQAAIEAALNSYIHPDYWIWNDNIWVNEIIALVNNVSGVDRVVSVVLSEPSAYPADLDLVSISTDASFIYSATPMKGILPRNVLTLTVQ